MFCCPSQTWWTVLLLLLLLCVCLWEEDRSSFHWRIDSLLKGNSLSVSSYSQITTSESNILHITENLNDLIIISKLNRVTAFQLFWPLLEQEATMQRGSGTLFMALNPGTPEQLFLIKYLRAWDIKLPVKFRYYY